MKDLPNLDLVRSVAVLLVVFDHACQTAGFPFVHGYAVTSIGVFGVYLFFVHTALVLMWSLERKPHVLNFYIRRAFRIFPLAMCAVLLALALHWNLADVMPTVSAAPHYPWIVVLENLLLIQNFFFQPNIIGVFWTLTIETQMYIVLPALFLYASREKRVWQLVLIWGLAVMVATHLSLMLGNALVTVVPDFIPGVIAYVLYSKLKPRVPGWLLIPMLGALFALYMFKPGPRLAWVVMLLLSFLLPYIHPIRMYFVVKGSYMLAKYSYGIYVFHLFGLYVGFHLLALHSLAAKLAVSLLVTAVASIAGYHLIEKPLINTGNRLAKTNDRRDSARALAI